MDESELPIAEHVIQDGETQLRVARVRYSDSDQITVPEHALAATPFDIYVTTYAGGCVSGDTTVASVQGLRATVVPYQRVLTAPNAICTLALETERRRVRLTFMNAGEATVRIIGREDPDGHLVAVERRVLVQ